VILATFSCWQEASRLLLGLNCAQPLEAISLPDATTTLAETHNFDVQVIS
jgi:beta-ureidopropionase